MAARASNPERDLPAGRELIFAVAHEIANHLGGIRLQAHLLDEDLGPRGLAEASIAIDALAGRAAPLLALLRPILSPEAAGGSTAVSAARSTGGGWTALLASLHRQVEDEGTRGVRLEIETAGERPIVGSARAWLYPLLLSILGATLEQVAVGGTIILRAVPREAEVLLSIEDDGEPEELSPGAPLRGRPLTLAIARLLLARIGGRVEAHRAEGRTRVELVFPDRRAA